MKLRNASLLDFSRIEQIHREAEARFSTVPPPARLWALVSQTLSALLPLSQETLLYVAEDEGRVMGFVQTAFAASQVLGVPAGLFLANHWNWHVCFIAIVGLSILAIAIIAFAMEPVDAHLKLKQCEAILEGSKLF